MPTTSRMLHRFAAFVATTFVSLAVTAVASAMPLVPEGDPPIKAHYAQQSSGGIDWGTAAVSAASAAAIVLLALVVVALAAVRLRNRHHGGAAATS